MLLAQQLGAYRGRPEVLVLALPRGGVPVAFEVASALDAPLDVFVVRKLGVPGHEELAMGAIASGGVRILNTEVLESVLLAPWSIEETTEREQRELERRERLYRKGRPRLDVRGRTVLLVDDGLATGSSARAAVAALRRLGAGRIVVAVPVAPASTVEKLAREADEVVCLTTPSSFDAVGSFYESFPQTTDEEVRNLLARARKPERVVPIDSTGPWPAASRST
jgi:predicted phosphoribosyltransferase